ncbi:ClpP/crotonase [Heliocybe sulcata]|uniref:ClpP/crotonase n=1 Tax=Heliocybe sulcata TaxID=5364 RepID=A0A5C3N7W5_9AGAM|nr:ClpP/crotonase [Heliocybe sulcata]
MSYPVQFPVGGEPILTLTHPSASIWIIELHNGDDSRLTQLLVDKCLKPALDAVERHWREDRRKAIAAKDKEGGNGALIIVGNTTQDKFFSNGLDFARISGDSNFFANSFDPLLKRILLFPIPTIAAINGHCFAGGMMLSLACDYRVMTDASKRNAWMSMNEVHFGAPWPHSFASLLRAKVASVQLQRKIALEGHRFTPAEARDAGLVDYLVPGNTAAVLKAAQDVAERVSPLAKTGVFGLIKGRHCQTDLYRNAAENIDRQLRFVNAEIDDTAAKARL